MVLPITLVLAAAAALINIWLAFRVGQARKAATIWIGDGGNEPLIRRMRAQSNFIEYTPIALILFALVELAHGPSLLLWVMAALYLIGRLAHPFGMDVGGKIWARSLGAGLTMLVTLVLAVMAVLAAYHSGRTVTPLDPMSVNV